MTERKVVFLTTVNPSAVGHGGAHRSFQIVNELEQMVGPENVMLFTKHHLFEKMQLNDKEQEQDRQVGAVKEWTSHSSGRAKRLIKNPYRLIQRTQFATGLHPRIHAYYEQCVKNLDRAVCVMEHAEFADLISINQKYNIPTISCTQNLDALGQNFESLSTSLTAIRASDIGTKQKAGIYAALMDFANELQIYAKCDERLFISKLETGLISGFGLSAQYYPYLPVGEIRDRLFSIRHKRATQEKDSGLFVLVGTAAYGPIKKSCEWLIERVKNSGLPEGVRIVVAGEGTDALLKSGEKVSGMEFKGWIKQEEMDQLLVRANAFLIPQRFGFGIPTRIAEMSCAGVPMIGDRHPTYSMDTPPGFLVVEGVWASWREKIIELSRKAISPAQINYESWEANQPRPLGKVIDRMLG